MSTLFSTLSHDPRACADALRGAAPGTEITVDLETTGLGRRHRIVSIGVLVADQLFILFVGSRALSIAPFGISLDELRAALTPVAERNDLNLVFHHAGFDCGFLHRAGIQINCPIFDTAKLFLLLDSDRKRKEISRRNRRFRQPTDYRLKNLVLHELGLDAPHFPGKAEKLSYRKHVTYLASDCIITREASSFLQKSLRPEDLEYYRNFVAPITPLLVAMTNAGVSADGEFIRAECDRLASLMRKLSREHQRAFGQRLDAGDFALRGHIYFSKGGLRCFVPKTKWVKVGARRLPPLNAATLAKLRADAEARSPRQRSLGLIMDYFLLRGLLVKLATLRDKHLDHVTGRIFTTLDDWQPSGRISSTRPNLQGVANVVTAGAKRELVSDLMTGVEIKSRNAIVSSPGYRLASFDINRADIASWAHAVESVTESGAELIQRLERERRERLDQAIAPYLERMWDHYRPHNRKPILCPICGTQQPLRRNWTRQTVDCHACRSSFAVEGRAPAFDPSAPSRLVEDLSKTDEDFYSKVAARILGRTSLSKTERNAMKQTTLAMVNGMTAPSLAAKLGVDAPTARSYIEQFAAAYSKEMSFISLMHHAQAITGYSETFGGRRRRVTPHFWAATECEIELFISYRGADKLWVRVVPLQPGRHVLTAWVLSVIDSKYDSPRRGQEIYHHRDGRISHAPYRFFDDYGLVFGLPVRNISWRIIRRVRTHREEAVYQGFDTTRRQLTNHIFQGSTADVARLMMLRIQPVCREFGARLVLQIHDELLFEIPGSRRQLMKFVCTATRVLEQPPTPTFAVPITVGPKVGTRFGELQELERWEYASPWHVRLWRHSARQVRHWLHRWRRGWW